MIFATAKVIFLLPSCLLLFCDQTSISDVRVVILLCSSHTTSKRNFCQPAGLFRTCFTKNSGLGLKRGGFSTLLVLVPVCALCMTHATNILIPPVDIVGCFASRIHPVDKCTSPLSIASQGFSWHRFSDQLATRQRVLEILHCDVCTDFCGGRLIAERWSLQDLT